MKDKIENSDDLPIDIEGKELLDSTEIPITQSLSVREEHRQLYTDLCDIAQTMGDIDFEFLENGLLWRCGERGLRFIGEGTSIKISMEGWPIRDEHRLVWEPMLSKKWVLHFHRHGQNELIPLFDRGLDQLLEHGLGRQRRQEPMDKPMSSRLADALLKPATMAGQPEVESPPAPVLAPKPRRL